MADGASRDVPRLVAYWLIPLPLIIHLCSKYYDSQDQFFSVWIESESGIIENATVLLLMPAALFALSAAYRLWQQGCHLAGYWFLGVALVCIGFGGEEISWGQHWFGWQSPDYFVEHNRQGETNLHNFNIQFGRLVKTILTLAIVLGGLVWPLLRGQNSPQTIDLANTKSLITATIICVPAACWTLGIRLVERLKTWFDLEWVLLSVNLKELQELYIALFLLIYAWSIKIRTDHLKQ